MGLNAKPPLLEAPLPLTTSCATPITSTYLTTIRSGFPHTSTFERYITDFQRDRTTTITQTIIEATQRTATSQFPVTITFCAQSPQSTTSPSIPIGIDQSSNLSSASSFPSISTSTTIASAQWPTSGPTTRPPPSKTPAIVAAATMPIVVFILVMWIFYCFRRRTERKKSADLEHITLGPVGIEEEFRQEDEAEREKKERMKAYIDELLKPTSSIGASTTIGTTAVGQFIPEDSISYVQHTNPVNPVDHSLESTVAPTQIEEDFNISYVSGPYRQPYSTRPSPPQAIYSPVAVNHNITEASEGASKSDGIHHPEPSRPLSVAIDQFEDTTNGNPGNSNPPPTAINQVADMVIQQPYRSRQLPLAIDQLPDLANCEPRVAQPHHNFDLIMDLPQPVVPIPQTPPQKEAARQRALNDAMRHLEGRPARPYSRTGFDWRKPRHLSTRDTSFATVAKDRNDDDLRLSELRERLCEDAQRAMHRQNGLSRYRDAGEVVEAPTQRRRGRDEEVARQMTICAGNLPDVASVTRQEETVKQEQMRPCGGLQQNARRAREAVVKQRPGARDRGPTIDAAEATFQRLLVREERAGNEERQRRMQMLFQGIALEDTPMARGAGGDQRLETRRGPLAMDDCNAFRAGPGREERSVREERELRRQIAEGVEYSQRRTEDHRERIRGKEVTDTCLTDFDVDAVNRQTANQPPRLRPMSSGRLDSSQVMPHAMPRPRLHDSTPRAHMRRQGWEGGREWEEEG